MLTSGPDCVSFRVKDWGNEHISANGGREREAEESQMGKEGSHEWDHDGIAEKLGAAAVKKIGAVKKLGANCVVSLWSYNNLKEAVRWVYGEVQDLIFVLGTEPCHDPCGKKRKKTLSRACSLQIG